MTLDNRETQPAAGTASGPSAQNQNLNARPAAVKGRNAVKPETTLQEDVTAAGLSKVFQRHGRVDLEPMPSDDPNDPLNWSSWRKNTMLGLVAWHTLMGPFAAAAIIPAYVVFTQDFGISITQASYLTSVQILFLGVFPLLWSPVSSRIGRRPMFLLSTLLSAAITFACAYCRSYGTLMAVRVLQAIFVCPPQAIGAATVNEMFFSHERGQKMGIWALLVGLGPPLAPLIFGFVVYNKSWPWIFYILSMIFLAMFVLYLFFGPETLYDRPDRQARDNETLVEAPIAAAPAKGKGEALPASSSPPTDADGVAYSYTAPLVTFKRHDPSPWKDLPYQTLAPLKMFLNPHVFLAATAYAVCFTYSNVLLTVETPALLGEKYLLNSQQTGLQFIAYTVGALLGEPIAGFGSDRYMSRRTKRHGGERRPEYRLPFSIPGIVLCFVGILVFFVQLNNTREGRWSVTPLIGGGIAFFGLQLVSTVCVTYAVESQAFFSPVDGRKAAVFTAFWRQLFAFCAPFYFSDAFTSLGLDGAGGLFASLQILMILPVLLLIFRGLRLREKQLAKL